MKLNHLFLFSAVVAMSLASCKEKPNNNGTEGGNTGEVTKEKPEWYYTGGQLGTTYSTQSTCFRQPSPATSQAGMDADFSNGDMIAEKPYITAHSGRQHGLGPIYVRESCEHCHPAYSHGESVPEGRYNAKDMGNGTLLVVYDPKDNGYVPWLAGMPQLFGAYPFKAPLDPDKINVTWHVATDEHGNTFPDGTKYELRYPEVTIPKDAFYVYNQGFATAANDPDGKRKFELLNNEGYVVVLENTIGVYGTGLLDAITDEDIIAQYEKEANDGYMKNGLNPAFWNGGFQTSGYYKNDPQWGPKRFTYALTRGPILDAAGANAIWNITNVTRSDRRYHYLDMNGNIYAECASKDKELQAAFPEYIAQVSNKDEHPEWFTDDVEANIYNYLKSTSLPAEMSDAEFTQVMIWHRGLAVPAARDVEDKQVLRGREVFSELGCDYCHRPTWTTGADELRDPNGFFTSNEQMPRYPYQKIWPYTDMVQHKLCMENDIRTGWCRTTPLWGRGLHRKATGDMSDARLHDTRARDVIEAVMWHGYSKQSDAYEVTQKFYNLPTEDRDAIVAFLNAI